MGPLQHFLRSKAKNVVRVPKNPKLSCPTPKRCCKGSKKPKKPNLFQTMFGSTCDQPGIRVVNPDIVCKRLGVLVFLGPLQHFFGVGQLKFGFFGTLTALLALVRRKCCKGHKNTKNPTIFGHRDSMHVAGSCSRLGPVFIFVLNRALTEAPCTFLGVGVGLRWVSGGATLTPLQHLWLFVSTW